jgi:hypothetical protein
VPASIGKDHRSSAGFPRAGDFATWATFESGTPDQSRHWAEISSFIFWSQRGNVTFMWRAATASDDDAVVSMCVALNAEDPGPVPVRSQQVRCTLAKLREESDRGRAVVCDVDGRTVGYALQARRPFDLFATKIMP